MKLLFFRSHFRIELLTAPKAADSTIKTDNEYACEKCHHTLQNRRRKGSPKLEVYDTMGSAKVLIMFQLSEHYIINSEKLWGTVIDMDVKDFSAALQKHGKEPQCYQSFQVLMLDNRISVV